MPAVDLITLISQLEESHSFSTVQDIVRQRAHFYGYDKIVFFSAHSTLDGIIERIYWIEGDWFDDGENIDAATYIKYCPITRHIIETDRPFFWTKNLTSIENNTEWLPNPKVAAYTAYKFLFLAI